LLFTLRYTPENYERKKNYERKYKTKKKEYERIVSGTNADFNKPTLKYVILMNLFTAPPAEELDNQELTIEKCFYGD
jgi:uncharacterized protein Smg (DUF494 family)